MIKRLLLCFILILIPFTVKAETGKLDDHPWYLWSQNDYNYGNYNEWNKQSINHQGMTNADSSFGRVGCFVYSVVVQAYRSGVTHTSQGKPLNPGTFKDALVATGGIKNSMLHHGQVNLAVKDGAFKLVTNKQYPNTVDGVRKAIADGYYPIVQTTNVPGGTHFEPVSHVEDNGDIIIFGVANPGESQVNYTKKYGAHINQLQVFEGPKKIQDGLQSGEAGEKIKSEDSDSENSSNKSGGNSDPFIWQKEVIVDYEENKDDGSKSKGLESANKRSFFEFITGQ